LIAGIVLISLSNLSITGTLALFDDKNFLIRIGIWTLVLVAAWLVFYYVGRKTNKAALMALGAGFPFALGNIWMNPMILTVTAVLTGDFAIKNIIIFFVSVAILAPVCLTGYVHFQKTLGEGNASIVIPLQQTPQQIVPALIYFFLFMYPVERVSSYFYMAGGAALIVAGGFILGKRQSEFESKFKN
jgi:hypothetical protein